MKRGSVLGRSFLIRTLRDLIRIETCNPPGNEKQLASHLHEILREYGIASRVQTVGKNRANLIARIGGGSDGPTLVLNGHLDTVPVKDRWDVGPFNGVVRDGKIYGLGAADMKGAIASMLGAAIDVARGGGKALKGTLMLAFVADEERTNLGTLGFLDTHQKIDAVVIGEPTNLSLVTSNRGVLRFRITTYGVAGHCSNPGSGVNAIYKMVKALNGLMESGERYAALRRGYAEKPSLSVTLIQGGTAENIIPDRCEIVIDRRTVAGEEASAVKHEIIELLEEEARKDGEYRYSCELFENMPPWKVKENSPLLQYCTEAFQSCFGRPPVPSDLGATSEAGLFSDRGIDTILFGPGNMNQAHTKNEYVEIEQLIAAQAFYASVIHNMLTRG